MMTNLGRNRLNGKLSNKTTRRKTNTISAAVAQNHRCLPRSCCSLTLSIFKSSSVNHFLVLGFALKSIQNHAESRHGLRITELTSWTPLGNVPCLRILGSIQLWRAFVCCFGIFGASLLESLCHLKQSL